MCVCVCGTNRVRKRGRRENGMSPECVTFQPSAGCCVYLFLSPAEMRSDVAAAVVCYLCYGERMKWNTTLRPPSHSATTELVQLRSGTWLTGTRIGFKSFMATQFSCWKFRHFLRVSGGICIYYVSGGRIVS